MTADRLVLVTGATGSQGGAVARELLAKGWRVRALTRKPDSDAAKALAAKGAEIVAGDLDDAASLRAALAGVWGVWAVQNTWEAGVEKEEVQGKALAHLARESGVQHYVQSSVGGANRNTGIPHFDNKWRIEQTVRSLGFPSHAVLRPVFFMENLVGPWFLQGDKLVTALDPATKLQMVAVEDIGRYGAMLFQRAEEMNGIALDLAGDAVTLPEAAAALSRALGREITYQPIPIAMVRQNSEDMAKMLEWFDETGYDADIVRVPRFFGIPTLTLAPWAAKRASR
jgi:uncharacterized protein YbjT (DUF2867 family)